MKVGDKFIVDFPFVNKMGDNFPGFHRDDWVAGVRHVVREPGDGEVICDDIGKRVLEVLAIAEMPKGYQKRVIYKNTWITPRKEAKQSKTESCTVSHFEKISTTAPRYEWCEAHDND